MAVRWAGWKPPSPQEELATDIIRMRAQHYLTEPERQFEQEQALWQRGMAEKQFELAAAGQAADVARQQAALQLQTELGRGNLDLARQAEQRLVQAEGARQGLAAQQQQLDVASQIERQRATLAQEALAGRKLAWLREEEAGRIELAEKEQELKRDELNIREDYNNEMRNIRQQELDLKLSAQQAATKREAARDRLARDTYNLAKRRVKIAEDKAKMLGAEQPMQQLNVLASAFRDITTFGLGTQTQAHKDLLRTLMTRITSLVTQIQQPLAAPRPRREEPAAGIKFVPVEEGEEGEREAVKTLWQTTVR